MSNSILVVDDTRSMRKMVASVLQAAGYQVTAVATALEALAMLKDGRAFDAVVTDIEMPEMDGYMLTKAIKSDPRFAGIPVLMHSSLSSASNQKLGKSVGVDEYVPKFEPQRLAETLIRTLNIGGPADAAQQRRVA